jgi:predicted PP-loop superfamily ATPase
MSNNKQTLRERWRERNSVLTTETVSPLAIENWWLDQFCSILDTSIKDIGGMKKELHENCVNGKVELCDTCQGKYIYNKAVADILTRLEAQFVLINTPQ